MEKKKNIILFLADQMRKDSLHHFGNEASITPNMDSLLNDGVSFENAYCQNPVCVPSRTSFLTGLYPHTNGHRTMYNMQKEDEPNILKTMKDNGYYVIWIGRNDFVPFGSDKSHCCDEFYDGTSYENMVNLKEHALKFNIYPKKEKIEMNDDRYYSFYIGEMEQEWTKQSEDWKCVELILKKIEEKANNKDGKPLFIYCSLFYPHPPYGCEAPWYSSVDRNKLPTRRPNIETLENKPSILHAVRKNQNLFNWTEERYNELRGTYLDMVSRFDYQLGLIINKLKETTLYDDTNLVVFSDHGDYTGDYGIVEKNQNTFEDPLSNVPLLIKPSKNFKVIPRKTKAFAELLDIPATIAEMADIEIPYTQFGNSLLDVVAGLDFHRDAVFCEGGRLHSENHAKDPLPPKQSPYWPRLQVQQSDGPEHTKACMIRMDNMKYTMRLYEKDELYDLDSDPMELNNIIDDENYSEIKFKLKERMLKFYMETCDTVPIKKDIR